MRRNSSLASRMRPSKSQRKIPMMLESTRRRIFASLSRTASSSRLSSVMSYEMKKRVIGLKDTTFQTRKENTDDVGVDQAPDLRFAFPQRLLGPFAFCYVCRGADELDELSVPIENRMTRGIDVPNCSV